LFLSRSWHPGVQRCPLRDNLNFCSHQIFRVCFSAYAAINYKIKGFNIKIFARSISHTSSSLALHRKAAAAAHPSVSRPSRRGSEILRLDGNNKTSSSYLLSTTGLSFVYFSLKKSKPAAARTFVCYVFIIKSILFSFGEIFSKWLHYRHVFYCARVCVFAHTLTARCRFSTPNGEWNVFELC
jgi:hypothetical protein